MNQGQICVSTERVVVAAEVLDEFTEELTKRAIHSWSVTRRIWQRRSVRWSTRVPVPMWSR